MNIKLTSSEDVELFLASLENVPIGELFWINLLSFWFLTNDEQKLQELSDSIMSSYRWMSFEGLSVSEFLSIYLLHSIDEMKDLFGDRLQKQFYNNLEIIFQETTGNLGFSRSKAIGKRQIFKVLRSNSSYRYLFEEIQNVRDGAMERLEG